jgi:hypothetical protein
VTANAQETTWLGKESSFAAPPHAAGAFAADAGVVLRVKPADPFLTVGNKKIGSFTPTFSLPSGSPMHGGTCPGATRGCLAFCYTRRGRQQWPAVQARYERNLTRLLAPNGLETFARAVPHELRALAAGICRIHCSGDFFLYPGDAPAYVRAWMRIVDASPRVSFWVYTRSFAVPQLLDALEALRRRPNVQMFASVDPTSTHQPPSGWRVAAIQRRDVPGLACPEQAVDRLGRKVQPSCATCRWCVEPPPERATTTNVVFQLH